MKLGKSLSFKAPPALLPVTALPVATAEAREGGNGEELKE